MKNLEGEVVVKKFFIRECVKLYEEEVLKVRHDESWIVVRYVEYLFYVSLWIALMSLLMSLFPEILFIKILDIYGILFLIMLYVLKRSVIKYGRLYHKK